MFSTSSLHRFVLLASACGALVASAAAQQRYWQPLFSQVDVTRDVQYGAAVSRHSNASETLSLDLYQPVGDTALLRPAVVLAHGGGFLSGSRLDPNLIDLAERLAQVGFVAVSVDYRLVPAPANVDYVDVVAASHDLKAAVRWLRSQAATLRIDVGRVACIGASAGAIAALDGFYREGEGNSGNPGWDSDVQCVVDLWGAAVDATVIEPHEPPVMILHGTGDPVVSFTFAQELEQRALTVGLAHCMHPLSGQGHAPWGVLRQSYIDNILGFLYEHLTLVELAGLHVRPGWASPGVVRVQITVPEGDGWLLYNSWAAPVTTPIPGLGLLQLDPASAWFVAAGNYGGPASVGTQSHFEWVPAGIAGSARWQVVTLRNGTFRCLSNSVDTPF